MIKSLIIALVFCVVLPAILLMAAATAYQQHYADAPHGGGGCFEPAHRPQAEPC